jgi:hypothetical protein
MAGFADRTPSDGVSLESRTSEMTRQVAPWTLPYATPIRLLCGSHAYRTGYSQALVPSGSRWLGMSVCSGLAANGAAPAWSANTKQHSSQTWEEQDHHPVASSFNRPAYPPVALPIPPSPVVFVLSFHPYTSTRIRPTLRKTPMDLNKRQQLGSQQGDAPAGPASGLVAPDAPNTLWAAIPPSETCKALCCRRGGWWVAHHLALDDYRNGPSRESLDTWGCWNAVCGGVMARAGAIRALGLAPWDMLSPPVRERFKRWTPVAQNLWESDFDDHREAMVRAWIWHYLDDNLFSFSPSAGPGELVSCASPVWEHVRLLRRDVDGKWRATTFGFTFAPHPPHPPSGPD